LLLWIFSVELGWFPTSGRVSVLADPVNGLRHLALPAIALGGGTTSSAPRGRRGWRAAP
jgi:peptide/nickel transport system permease protein